MIEDVIERYDNFNTGYFTENLICSAFNNQPIPSTYSDLTNVYDDDVNPIDSALADNKGAEDGVITNDENNYGNRLDSDIYPTPPLPKQNSGN